MRSHCSLKGWCPFAFLLLLPAFSVPTYAQAVVQCAQVPCDDVRTVAAATTGVPVEHDLNANAGLTYYVSVTDLGAQFQTPQPLSTLKLAITFNDALVSLMPVLVSGSASATTQLVVDGANAVSTNGTALASFTATATGAYRIHVVGEPASGNAPGPIGLQVSATQGGPALQSWSDSIGLPGLPPAAAEGILQQTFAVTTAGTFQISLNDLSLPQPLQASPILIVLNGSNIVATLPDPGNNLALHKTVTLAAGSYQLYAAGLAAANAPGGLFSASVIPVSGGGGAPAFAWTVPVGGTIQVGGAVQLSSAAPYTLKLTDLAFPGALSQVAAMAVDVSQGVAAASAAAAGTQSFSAASGDTYSIYAVAQAAATPGAGSYSAQILPQTGGALTGNAEAVTVPGGSLSAYTFTANVNVTAGSNQPYVATLSDFKIPASLGVADFALVEGGAIIGAMLSSPGNISVNLPTGSNTLTLLAFAAPGTAGGGFFNVSVADGAGNLVFSQPQGVGVGFKPVQISITAAGTYQFTLADLSWPATFSQTGGQLDGILTQGGNVVGEIFGVGTLSPVSVTAPGNYFLSILAIPTDTDQAGTYALNVSTAPAAPTVSLTADVSNANSGGTAHLIWMTSGATSCVASGGGWSGTFAGSQAAQGTTTSPAIAADTTFTLTCNGAGGQTAGSVTVKLASSSSGTTGSSSGGGGALGSGLLWMLAACATAALRCRRVQ